jgi:hypothetical protein
VVISISLWIVTLSARVRELNLESSHSLDKLNEARAVYSEAQMRLLQDSLLYDSHVYASTLRIEQTRLSDTLNLLLQILPEEIVLVALYSTESGELTMSGTSLTLDALAGFIQAIESNKYLRILAISPFVLHSNYEYYTFTLRLEQLNGMNHIIR